jgi:hypothetical protein
MQEIMDSYFAVNILFVVAFPIFMDLVDSLKQQNSERN